MILLALYFAILIVGLCLAIARRKTLLVRGRGLFLLTMAAEVLALVECLVRNRAIEPWTIPVWLTALGVALAARPRWFFLWYAPDFVAAEVEGALRRLLIPFLTTSTGYTLKLRSGEVYLDLHARPLRTAWLRFRKARGQPKADLLRSLLRKRFDPLFPRPRIRLA